MSAYDFDNTAPDAIALASSSPDNTPPVAIAIASSSPDNTGPTAIALPSEIPDETPPVAITLASSSPDNSDATAIALASQVPDNTAPTGIDLADSTPITEPARARFIPGNSLALPQNETVNTPILTIEGMLTLNQLFGHIQIPANCALTSIQVQLGEPPVGGPLTIELVKPDGTLFNANVTVADGADLGTAVFSTPLHFVTGDEIRGKATAVGPTTAGGFGALTLFTQLA